MEYIADIFGGISILVGTLIYLWRNKRAFDRTNTSGIQRFSSYTKKLSARLGDTLLWVVAVFITILGTVVLAQAHQETWGNVVYALFFVWLFVGVFFFKSK